MDASCVGATNNFGFVSSIPSAANNWNLYLDGTAKNYLAGSLLIGSTTDAGFKLDVTGTTRLQGDTTISSGSLGIGTSFLTGINLNIGKSITGGTTAYGIVQGGTVQSDVTTQAFGTLNQLNTQASTFTIQAYTHFQATQGTIGSGSTITSQYGFQASSGLISATNNYGFYGNIPSGTNRWNLYMSGTANNYLAGNLLIGSTTDTGQKLQVTGTVLATSLTDGFITISSAQINRASATVELQFTSTGNVRFFGNSSTPITFTGSTGAAVFNNAVGIGTGTLLEYSLNIAKNITGATTAYGVRSQGTVQSDVTTLVSNFGSLMNTAAASFTLTDFVHHRSMQGTIGSGSVVTNQYGYFADSSMTGATNNYGFYGNIPSGSNRWNIYMGGTANNYFAGSLGIGTTSLSATSLAIAKNITGNTIGSGISNYGIVQSDVTGTYYGYYNGLYTQATAFTLNNYYHFSAQQASIGSGSSITTQIGFYASSMSGATNNYGFRGQVPSASNNWNLYMDGTANNYLAGSLGIGTTGLTQYSLRVVKNITGNVFSYGISQSGIVQSDVTSAGWGYHNQLYTVAASFTLSNYYHFFAEQQTIGAGSTVSNQTGFHVSSTLIGAATNNYGFRGEIPSGTNRWNIYMGGTAQNYLAGALSIGVTTANASALLQVDSTTQGVLFPRMTTTQKNAISSPATGLVVFDTTLGKLCVFSTTWQTITSS